LAVKKKKNSSGASRASQERTQPTSQTPERAIRHQELWGVGLLALGVFVLISVFSSEAGLLGGMLQRFFFGFMGISAYLAGPLLILGGGLMIFTTFHPVGRRNYVFFTLTLVTGIALVHLFSAGLLGLDAQKHSLGEFMTRAWNLGRLDHAGAGVLGVWLGYLPQMLVGVVGGRVLLIALEAAWILVWTGISLAAIGRRAEETVVAARDNLAERRARANRKLFVAEISDEDYEDPEEEEEPETVPAPRRGGRAREVFASLRQDETQQQEAPMPEEPQEELEERTVLRNEYLEAIRRNFKAQLDNIEIVD